MSRQAILNPQLATAALADEAAPSVVSEDRAGRAGRIGTGTGVVVVISLGDSKEGGLQEE